MEYVRITGETDKDYQNRLATALMVWNDLLKQGMRESEKIKKIMSELGR